MYVLALNFSPSALERQAMLDFLNTRQEIRNWLAVNESLILMVSTALPVEFQQIVHTAFPQLSFLIFLVHSHEANGRETPNVWEFINHPKSSGYWENMVKGIAASKG